MIPKQILFSLVAVQSLLLLRVMVVVIHVILNRMLCRLQHASKDDKTDPKSHTNYQYLSMSEKHERLKKLHDQCKVMKQQLNRTQQKLDEAMEQREVVIHEEDLHEELETIIDEQSPFIAESYPNIPLPEFFGKTKKELYPWQIQDQ